MKRADLTRTADKSKTPRWKQTQLRTQKKRSTAHEDRLAGEVGGRRLPASGATAWSRWNSTTAGGDVTSPHLHLEHKFTDKKSLTVHREWLDKVSQEAKVRGKIPALAITFDGIDNKPDLARVDRPAKDWVAIPLGVLTRLLGLWDRREDESIEQSGGTSNGPDGDDSKAG